MSSLLSHAQGVKEEPQNMEQLHEFIQTMDAWDDEHMQAWFKRTLGDVEHAQPLFDVFFKPGADPKLLAHFKSVFFAFASQVVTEMESECGTSEEVGSGNDSMSELTVGECSVSSTTSGGCEESPRVKRKRSVKVLNFTRQKPRSLLDGSDADDELTDSINSSLEGDLLLSSFEGQVPKSSEEENTTADSSFEEDITTIRRALKKPKARAKPILVNLSTIGPFRHHNHDRDCPYGR